MSVIAKSKNNSLLLVYVADNYKKNKEHIVSSGEFISMGLSSVTENGM